MRTNPNLNRRGLAMMLVLVGLMTGTILATAYLASRDNSAAIGENIAAAAAARWGAASALELGIAVMQTETDWRTSHINGKLLDDYPLAAATIDLDLIDLETGLPPTDESQHFSLTATATVQGLTQTVTATAFVSNDAADSVDVDLSEFAIFTRGTIVLRDTATVTRWTTAPLSKLGRRIAFGTQSTTANSVWLTGAGAAIDTTVYHGPFASLALINNPTGPAIDAVELIDAIPMPAPPAPAAGPPDGVTTYPDLSIVSPTTIAASDRRNDIEFESLSGTSTLIGDIEVVAEEDIFLQPGSKVIIDGHVDLIAFGAMTLDDASIELAPGATLRIFVGDSLKVGSSYIGDQRVDDLRDNSGMAAWMDPQRIQIFTISPGPLLPPSVILDNNAVVKGSLYVPTASVLIKTASALYGRVAANQVALTNDGALFYDHTLHSDTGFTNLNSLVYRADRRIKEKVLGLASLDNAMLVDLSNELELRVKANGTTVTGEDVALAPPPLPLPPGQPTPRPVPVEYEIVSFGTDMRDWEKTY